MTSKRVPFVVQFVVTSMEFEEPQRVGCVASGREFHQQRRCLFRFVASRGLCESAFFFREMNIGVLGFDQRRIEVFAQHFQCFNGVLLVLNTTVRRVLQPQSQPACCLDDGIWDKERIFFEVGWYDANWLSWQSNLEEGSDDAANFAWQFGLRAGTTDGFLYSLPGCP